MRHWDFGTLGHWDMHKGALMRLLNCAALAAVLAIAICAPARSATTWTEGVNYS
jgi:hypothetical protein